MFTTLCLVFSLFCVSSVLCGDGPIKKAVEGAVKSSDVLHVDMVKANLPNFSYQIEDLNFLRLNECSVSNMKVENEKSIFHFDLECPKIVITATHYVAKGSLLDQPVDANGKLKVTADDYFYTIACNYKEKIDENNKTYLHIKDFKVDQGPRGTVVFGLGNLSDGDEEKSEMLFKYFNANWRKLDKLLRNPAVNRCFAVFMENLNKCLKTMGID